MQRIKHCYLEIESKSTIDTLYRSDIIDVTSQTAGNVYRIDGPLIDNVASSFLFDWNENSNHDSNFTTTQIPNYDDTYVYRLKLKVLLLRQEKGRPIDSVNLLQIIKYISKY